MVERRDYVALDWVAGEIEETLKQAAQALDAYIANRDDATKLRFCLTHIHQVLGTLRMVEFFGAALLAEEMEYVADAISHNRIHENHVEDALQVLHAAMVQLPRYLERVKASRHGLPSILLPVLNDLRAVRGEQLLSETVLFAPDMSVANDIHDVVALSISGKELAEIAHKLRQMYQIALLGLIRGKDVRKNLNYLAKVCARLVKVSEGQSSQAIWRVCIAVLEGLLNGSIETSVSVKILLRQVDKQIKNIIDQGEQAVLAPYPEDLVKNLLYYVARSKANSRYIKEIKNDFNLAGSLLGEGDLEGGDLATPDSAAMHAVILALVKELSDIQQQMQVAATDSVALAAILPLFRRVCDTMAILGLGSQLKQLQELYTRFAKQLATDIDAQELSQILAGISAISLELKPEELVEPEKKQQLFNDSEEAQGHLDAAFDSVLRESRVGLEQAKDAVIEFVATQWDHNCLTEVPAQLQNIIGSLSMVPLARASKILQSCETYISQDLLVSKGVPDWQVLDTLADAITSIDYYLERLVEDPESDGSMILDMAADSVAELGYPVAAEDAAHVDEPSLLSAEAEQRSPELDEQPPVLEVEPPLLDAEPPVLVAETPAQEPPLLEAELPELTEDVSELAPEYISALAEVMEAEYVVDADDAVIDFEMDEALGDEDLSDAPVAAAVAAAPIEDDEDYDPEIVEIFIEEAAEVLETIGEYLPQWQADHANADASDTVRRAFHTLKGSGRMVGATAIGELAWAIESLLNTIIDGSLAVDSAHLTLAAEVAAYAPTMVSAFEHRQTIEGATAQSYIARAEAYIAGDEPVIATPETASKELDDAPVLQIEDPAEAITEDVLALELADEPEEEIDSELLEIFAGEAATHREVLNQFIAHYRELAGPADLTDDLQRALHTLKGSANMAGIGPVAMIVGPVEGLIKDLRAMQMKADHPIIEVLEQTSAYILQGAEQLGSTPLQTLPGSEDFLVQLSVLHQERLAIAADADAEDNSIPPQALNEFLTLSLDVVSDADQTLIAWPKDELSDGDYSQLLAQFARMIERGEAINMPAFVELAQAMQVLYRQAIDAGEKGEAFCALASQGNDALIDMLDQIAGHQTPGFDEALLIEIEDFSMQAASPVAEPVTVEIENDNESAIECIDFESAELESSPEPEPEPEPEPLAIAPKSVAQQAEDDDDEELDEEIIEIFMEEAGELLESLDEAIHAWSEDRNNRAHPDELLRVLHTLKGGARLAGISSIGDLSHDFETRLESLNLDNLQADDALMAETLASQDQLVAIVEQLKQGESIADLTAELPAVKSSADTVTDTAAQTTKFDLKPAVEKRNEFNLPLGSTKVEKEVAPFTAPAFDSNNVKPLPVDSKRGPQEVVKVSAQLLEELVNLAGETSISRGRAEEQISELVFSLDDMQITVDRLQQQVRRLDMETEQQILFRQEQVESEGLDGFDPLEMDRYSQLQQLSRSLLESSSDLTDIKGTLADKARDMETLLVQQSRINTELQEGLMRSRMVPFSRMVPRLRRIVRQVSGELDKKVDFRLDNVEGELDRTVLERMVAPLEHMLRNAVDHGIETKEQRQAAGKSPRGTVALNLAREGGEIVLTLSDDGAGVNLAAVQKKAIERGLMEQDASLSNHEILQFILQAGFSTAEKITQISGRGVGMDVVHSEIKQLGGTMDIESIYGQGTRFIVRLPFTVSVNRALMVNIGGDNYAIPLNTIEGIVRVSPFELEAYYQPDAPLFEYAGQSYLLRYMGALLNRGEMPNLEGRSMPLPVILVRGADHSVAIQVDHLMGSREIVVKPMGPQFSMVQGLSGATVLGDGNVVIILDLPAMIRADAMHAHRGLLVEQEEGSYPEDRITKVMVVDDSVTVRKVTSRFLERQGMEVVLAKDGLDAVAQLNDMERIPDVMLLDIEMPRMDGFEVASRVRHTSRLKDLPIIMITSRTGDKHRERAMSLGVNHYLGKPYQETVLLETILELTDVVAGR
ncbi:Hpt domain-containing protein [Dasania marina]|uniref:hybrid sensor histidine kinase/response regulator n=1 Tax=Dasania marina TaxID=471499 RepID=UPI0030DD8484|tara:strand:- start:3277 stop:9219 length:5943 start_codon:yes stop_codon:yes gene_type:complete